MMNALKHIAIVLTLALALQAVPASADSDEPYALRFSDGKLRIGASESDDATESAVMSGFKRYYINDTLSRSFRTDLESKAYPLINGYSFYNNPTMMKGGLMFFNTETSVYNMLEVGKIYTNTDQPNVEPCYVAPEHSLRIIDNLKPTAFRYNYEKDASGIAPLHYGFVAQEVEKVVPEAVDIDAKGVRAIDPTAILAHALASVGELGTQLAQASFTMRFIEKEMLTKASYLKVLDGTTGQISVEYFYAGDTDGQIVISDISGNVLLSELCSQGRNIVTFDKRSSVKSVYLVSLLHKADAIHSIRVVK